jgi:hypothetical protein
MASEARSPMFQPGVFWRISTLGSLVLGTPVPTDDRIMVFHRFQSAAEHHRNDRSVVLANLAVIWIPITRDLLHPGKRSEVSA